MVEKWWSPRGSLKDSIIAMKGEAGYQPEVLRGGIHLRSPFMYRVRIMPPAAAHPAAPARPMQSTSLPQTSPKPEEPEDKPKK